MYPEFESKGDVKIMWCSNLLCRASSTEKAYVIAAFIWDAIFLSIDIDATVPPCRIINQANNGAFGCSETLSGVAKSDCKYFDRPQPSLLIS